MHKGPPPTAPPPWWVSDPPSLHKAPQPLLQLHTAICDDSCNLICSLHLLEVQSWNWLVAWFTPPFKEPMTLSIKVRRNRML